MVGDSAGPKRLKPEYIYYIVESLYAASTSFIAPIYVIFLLRSGLEFKGVAIVNGVYMISSALLEHARFSDLAY